MCNNGILQMSITLRTLLIAGTNFSGLVGSCIWRVLILAILPQASSHIYLYGEI